jgi:hypothetical protein
MSTKVNKLAVRSYFAILCAAAPVAILQAQAGGTGAGQSAARAGTGTAGAAAGQPGGGYGTAGGGAATGSSAAGQDLGYAQANNNDRGGSKLGLLGLLGLAGLLGLRGRGNEPRTRVRDDVPSYETTGTRRP